MADCRLNWQNVQNPHTRSYVCHYCGFNVVSERGWIAGAVGSNNRVAFIYICPSCTEPTFFDTEGKQVPAPRLGNAVNGITDKGVEALYNRHVIAQWSEPIQRLCFWPESYS